MRDKLAESRGVNAAIVAVTLLFAACTEHELATVAPASLQPSTDPVPATSEENLANGRAVAVRITDRGPYVKGRVIDLPLAAALRLGVKDDGTAPVRINVIASAPPSPATATAP